MNIHRTVIVCLAVAVLACGDFPSNPSTPDALNGTNSTSLAIVRNGDVLCAATAGNHVTCLPLTGSFGVLSTTALPAPVLALAGGYEDMCALLSDETVRCWRVDQPRTPAIVARGAVALTVSESGVLCTRSSSGEVECVCKSAASGAAVDCSSPVGLDGALDLAGTRARAVAAGNFLECAVLDDGAVRCRSGDTGVTAAVPGFAGVVELGVAETSNGGGKNICARLATGTVVCSGDNLDGQLGDGNTAPASAVVGVSGLTDVVELAVGASHSCARKADGTVWCWGWSGLFAGEQGCAGEYPCSAVPVQVQGIGVAVGLVAGDFRDCALIADGTVTCWGDWSSNKATGLPGGG